MPGSVTSVWAFVLGVGATFLTFRKAGRMLCRDVCFVCLLLRVTYRLTASKNRDFHDTFASVFGMIDGNRLTEVHLTLYRGSYDRDGS